MLFAKLDQRILFSHELQMFVQAYNLSFPKICCRQVKHRGYYRCFEVH